MGHTVPDIREKKASCLGGTNVVSGILYIRLTGALSNGRQTFKDITGKKQCCPGEINILAFQVHKHTKSGVHKLMN